MPVPQALGSQVGSADEQGGQSGSAHVEPVGQSVSALQGWVSFGGGGGWPCANDGAETKSEARPRATAAMVLMGFSGVGLERGPGYRSVASRRGTAAWAAAAGVSVPSVPRSDDFRELV